MSSRFSCVLKLLDLNSPVAHKNTPPQPGGLQRDTVLDSIKCCLIFLVVLGHVLLQTESYYSDRVIKGIISWIWFFHMPAFAIISGYFTNLRKRGFDFFKGVLSILLTYIIMQVVLSAIYYSFEPASFFTKPRYAIWYLLALPLWRIIFFALKKRISNTYGLIIIGVIMALGSGLVPTNILQFQRICSFFPFFCLGVLFREKDAITLFRKKMRLLGSLFLFILFLLFLIPNRMICSGMCDMPYNGLVQFFTRSTVLVLGTLMSVAFFSIIPNNRMLASLGKNTMFIYCYHIFFVFHVIPELWKMIGVRPNIFIIILYTLAIFFILGLLSRIKILNYLIKPL